MFAPESLVGAEMERWRRLERTVATNLVGSRVVHAWKLVGGSSAGMTAFEVELPGGERRRLVSRQPGAHRVHKHPDAVQREFNIIRAVYQAQLPVPEPLWLETGPEPFFVLEYIEGEPELDPDNRDAFLGRFAQQLAAVHRVNLDNPTFTCLSSQEATVPPVHGTLNQSFREGEIRAGLASFPPPVMRNPPVLRHGDLWPGNVLWRDGEVVAIIDWEEALIGEPLADLAICRLDLLWILGADGMDEFTRIYLAQAGLNSGSLPYWDLVASLRPIRNLGEWAAAYPPLGRPDVTVETMSRDHQWFVEQALLRL